MLRSTFYLLALFLCFQSNAQPYCSIPRNDGAYNDVVVQTDGKYIVVGWHVVYTDCINISGGPVIRRFNSNGSSDPTFQPQAVRENAVTIQNDNKILLTGSGGTIRLHPNGSLDATFSSSNINGVDIAASCDHIYLVTSNGVVRLNMDGIVDNSFDSDGMVITSISPRYILVQSDGKVILSNSTTAIRLNKNGSLDNTFSFSLPNNVTELAEPAMQLDGKIIFPAIYNGSELAALRLNSSGTLDASFSSDGLAILDTYYYAENAVGASVQSDGKIVVGGTYYVAFAGFYPLFAQGFVRFNPDGSPDYTIGNNSGFVLGGTTSISNAMALGDNKVYMAGKRIEYPNPKFFPQQVYPLAQPLPINGQPLVLSPSPSFQVIIPDALALSQGVSANTVYPGYSPASTITLIAQPNGSGPYTYQWSTGATTQSIVVSPGTETTYYVTVTNASGCFVQMSKTVKVIDVRCGNKGDKVLICKVALGNGNTQTLCLSPSAVPSHLATGSYLGSCQNSNKSSLQQAVSIEKLEEDPLKLTVQNNPSRTVFTLVIQGKTSAPVYLRIHNSDGKNIESKIVTNGSTEIGADYKPGIYFLEAYQGQEKSVLKLVKQ
jgi:uncharacterized delta-60 repeat protein